MKNEKLRIPEIVIPKAVELPPVETVTLPNGLPVHLICTPGQDVVRVSLVWAAGSSTQTKPFVASSTVNMLAEGSENFTAHEIAERLDFVGSYYEVNIDRDYAMATFGCLGKFFGPTLDTMGEILLRPAFPPEEVELYARKRMERLAVERSKPATKAREMFSAALFGDTHPYGVSSPESKYLDLRRDDIRKFHDRFYGADNCFAVCSMGDDPVQREALLALLTQMPCGTNHPVSPAGCPRYRSPGGLPGAFSSPAPAHCIRGRKGYAPSTGGELPTRALSGTPESDSYRFLEIPGAVQSAVRIGRLLFPRRHPDFIGMQVVATILGGYFGSRLTQNLREEKGYTYGVMAAMVNLREAGYLAIATEVGAGATADTVEQIFLEMERLKTEPVSEDELDTVRRSMLGEVMRILDGPFGIVDVVIEQIQIGGAESYINDFIREIESTTPERIQQLAQKYLDRDAFTTVIVGKE